MAFTIDKIYLDGKGNILLREQSEKSTNLSLSWLLVVPTTDTGIALTRYFAPYLNYIYGYLNNNRNFVIASSMEDL